MLRWLRWLLLLLLVLLLLKTISLLCLQLLLLHSFKRVELSLATRSTERRKIMFNFMSILNEDFYNTI